MQSALFRVNIKPSVELVVANFYKYIDADDTEGAITCVEKMPNVNIYWQKEQIQRERSSLIVIWRHHFIAYV